MSKPDSPLRDWDYVYALEMDDPERPPMDIHAELAKRPLGRMSELGCHFQQYLYGIVRRLAPPMIVETGVRSGVSTHLILHATDRNGGGILFSCDPLYKGIDQARDAVRNALGHVSFDDWRFYPKRSIDCLREIARETGGGWDLFVHDSDHRPENQTFELEYGWAMLRPGGLLICDDWEWPAPDGPAHHAFQGFRQRHQLTPAFIGSAAVLQRGEEDLIYGRGPVDAEQGFQSAVALAVAEARRRTGEAQFITYLASGPEL